MLKSFLEYHTSKPNLRIGQAFCNMFGITDAILFYETDVNKSWEMIYKKYMKYLE
jgi:hypothetical protein